MKNAARNLTMITIALLCVSEPLLAQRGRGGGGRGGGGRGGGFSRGGGGMASRGGARTSVTFPSGGSRTFQGGGAVNRPRPDIGSVNRGDINRGDINRGTINRGDINRGDINRGNIDRQVNVGDIDVHGGYYDRWGCCATRAGAAVAGAAVGAAVTAAAIGSVAYTLPASCTVVVVDDTTYEQCGSTWYRPQFSGTTTTYVVVSPPQ